MRVREKVCLSFRPVFSSVTVPRKVPRYVQATLTSFDGDVEGPMLGLFEGDWLGVVVGYDHMNISMLDEHDKNLIRYVRHQRYTRYVFEYSPPCLDYERENGLLSAIQLGLMLTIPKSLHTLH